MLLDTKYTLTNSTQRSHNILARRLNKLEKLEGSATNIDPSGVIQPQLGMPKEFLRTTLSMHRLVLYNRALRHLKPIELVAVQLVYLHKELLFSKFGS